MLDAHFTQRQLSFLSGTDNVWYTIPLPLVFLPKLTHPAARCVRQLTYLLKTVITIDYHAH